MVPMLDTESDRANWLLVEDDDAARIAAAKYPEMALYDHAADMEEAGEPLPVIGDDCTDLSLEDAMTIAGTYGGGEFDGEMGAIVIALCTLRDHIGADL